MRERGRVEGGSGRCLVTKGNKQFNHELHLQPIFPLSLSPSLTASSSHLIPCAVPHSWLSEISRLADAALDCCW